MQENRTQRYIPPSLRKKMETAGPSGEAGAPASEEQTRRTLEALELSRVKTEAESVQAVLKVAKDPEIVLTLPMKRSDSASASEVGLVQHIITLLLQGPETSSTVSSLLRILPVDPVHAACGVIN